MFAVVKEEKGGFLFFVVIVCASLGSPRQMVAKRCLHLFAILRASEFPATFFLADGPGRAPSTLHAPGLPAEREKMNEESSQLA